MFEGGPGIERDTPVAAGVMGLERAERELPGTGIERVRAKRIGHDDDLSGLAR
jgi:hypothetical protein